MRYFIPTSKNQKNFNRLAYITTDDEGQAGYRVYKDGHVESIPEGQTWVVGNDWFQEVPNTDAISRVILPKSELDLLKEENVKLKEQLERSRIEALELRDQLNEYLYPRDKGGW